MDNRVSMIGRPSATIGHDGERGGTFRGALQRQDRQHEAEEQTAGSARGTRAGIEIMQESEHGTGKHEGNYGGADVLMHDRDGHHC